MIHEHRIYWLNSGSCTFEGELEDFKKCGWKLIKVVESNSPSFPILCYFERNTAWFQKRKIARYDNGMEIEKLWNDHIVANKKVKTILGIPYKQSSQYDSEFVKPK